MYKLFISPHLDDIIFSLGFYLKKITNYQNIIIATVFTKENQKKLNKLKDEMYVYGNYKKRIEEDKNAMDELKGARVIYFDLEDEIFRSNESKLKMELKISNKINKLLLNYNIADIYLPLGIGYHNDHILVNNSVYHLNLSNYNLYYYYDYPYCNNKLNLLTRLSDYGIFNISLNLEIIKEYYKDPIYSSLNFFIKSIKVIYLLNRYLFNYLFRQYKLKGDNYSYKIITEKKFNMMMKYESQIKPIFGSKEVMLDQLNKNNEETFIKFTNNELINYNIVYYLLFYPLFSFSFFNYVIRVFCLLFLVKSLYFKNTEKIEKKFRCIELYILVPIYNEENNLIKLFDSLVVNDKIKYIMVNDNSTDNSLDILNKYKKKFNYKLINRKGKRGFVAVVLNDGTRYINNSNKEVYVGVINADSYVNKKDMMNIYKYLENHDVDVLNLSNISLETNNIYNYFALLEKKFKNKLFSDVEVSLNNGYFVKLNKLEEVNFWNEKEITEDLNLTIKLKEFDNTFVQSEYYIYDRLPNNFSDYFSQKYRWINGDLDNRMKYFPKDIFEIIVTLYYIFPLYTIINTIIYLLFNIINFKIYFTQLTICIIESLIYFFLVENKKLNFIVYSISQLFNNILFYFRYFYLFYEKKKWNQ
jgi:glycosyltransferase involved in cell wall biosynthesis